MPDGADPARRDPSGPPDDARWRAAGERIETLLDAVSVPGMGTDTARGRAEALVSEVVSLYGAGLERIVALAGDSGLSERLAADDLVASLLLVHGLHPHPLARRVSEALDSVRPYLGSHGGDVELLEVVSEATGGAVVRLRFAGSCRSCPSSAATLELAVADAVRAAAPEVEAIEVLAAPEPETEAGQAPLIAAESLMSRVRTGAPIDWHPVPDLATLTPGEVAGFRVGPVDFLACRVGEELFAYRDHCPCCLGSLAGAALAQRNGTVVLACPLCQTPYDVTRAGTALDGRGDAHGRLPATLTPMPLLERDGVLSLAVPAEPAGVPA